eukprot:232439_1
MATTLTKTIDWSESDSSIKIKLLQLSKPKLIKLCKQRKVSHQGNKKDIIDRLLKANKTNTTKHTKSKNKKKKKKKEKRKIKLESRKNNKMNITKENQQTNTNKLKKLLKCNKLAIPTDIPDDRTNYLYYECPDDDKEYIIISTDKKHYIYFYDILKNCFIPKYKHPPYWNGNYHKAILNTNNNTLYFVSYLMFATLELSSGAWNIRNMDNEFQDICEFETYYPYFISDTMFSIDTMFSFNDTAADTFSEMRRNLYEDSDYYIEKTKMLYCTVPYCRLLLIGGEEIDDLEDVIIYHDEIQYFDLKTEKEWKIMENVKIPFKCKAYDDAWIGFECILFCAKTDRHNGAVQFFCFDLLITNKWYKSEECLIDIAGIKSQVYFEQCVIAKNNNVHLMRCGQHFPYHLRFSLHDVIPLELMEIYQKYYKQLVNGYIKSYVEAKYYVSIPGSLKDLISYFYPCFI